MVVHGRFEFTCRRFGMMMALLFSVSSLSAQQDNVSPPPQLNGEHFRITAMEEGSFLAIEERDDGGLSFSGYLIDMLQDLAKRANFTYELSTPSGFGSFCSPQLKDNDVKEAYALRYRTQYNCGANDVNELPLSSNFSTHMYLGMYYISPERQRRNRFTMPFAPPYEGTPAMVGTATGIRNIDDLLKQQMDGKQPPVCILDSTATIGFVRSSFPGILIEPYIGSEDFLYKAMLDGSCPISVMDAPIAAQFVLRRSQRGECLGSEEKPIGVIGEPMTYGLSHYAIGVRKELPVQVVDTLSYWINILMSCNPLEPTGPCPDGNLASFFEGQGGTGNECGYVLYPESDDSLSAGAIAGIVIGSVAFVVILLGVVFVGWYRFKLKQQENRYKKRFVQQIARNINIGPSPGHIPPDKLSEQIIHIGDGKGVINKEDLAKWMHDIKLDFISQRDFDALWDAMDIEGKGEVDPVEFVVFLSACGPQFEKVYHEHQDMPKSERLKLAARRLSNISKYGEDGVRKNQSKLERSSRSFQP